MRKGGCVARARLPCFAPWRNRSDGGEGRRGIELEKNHEQIDDELPCRDIAGFLVGIKESDELYEWSGTRAAKCKAPNLRGRQCLYTTKELMQELVVVLFLTGDNGSDTTTRASCDNNTSLPPFNLK
jgi:hypothetical protein